MLHCIYSFGYFLVMLKDAQAAQEGRISGTELSGKAERLQTQGRASRFGPWGTGR